MSKPLDQICNQLRARLETVGSELVVSGTSCVLRRLASTVSAGRR
jgi:hypothetical protein